MIETIQRQSVISFPFLGLELNPPASVQLFGREIYFYGIIIALGFILAMFYCAKNAKRVLSKRRVLSPAGSSP